MSEGTQNHLEKVVTSCFIEHAEATSTIKNNHFIVHVKPDKAFDGLPIKIIIPIKTFKNYSQLDHQEKSNFDSKLINYINHQISKPVIWNIEI